MRGRGRFDSRWRASSAAACGHVPPSVRRQVFTVPAQAQAVREARCTAAATLTRFGVARSSGLADCVLLIVSELVTNVVRHVSGRFPIAEVEVAVGEGALVVAVADQDAGRPDLAGTGLRTVVELAGLHGGVLRVVPWRVGWGKAVLVRFPLPGSGSGPTVVGRVPRPRAL